MTPEERQLLEGLLDRLRAAQSQPRDPEAERLIADAVAAQPSIPYLLAQTVLVQDHALSAAHDHIQDLERQAQASQAPPTPAASFLPGNVAGGPWGQRAAPPPQQPPQQPFWSSAPPPPPPNYAPSGYGAPGAGSVPSSGGGFLRGALQTAAGVAGGALMFDAVQSLFHRSPFGGFLGGSGFGGGYGPGVVEETVVNNYYGNEGQTGGDPGQSADQTFDPGYDPGQQDGSGLTDATDYSSDSNDDFSGSDFSDDSSYT